MDNKTQQQPPNYHSDHGSTPSPLNSLARLKSLIKTRSQPPQQLQNSQSYSNTQQQPQQSITSPRLSPEEVSLTNSQKIEKINQIIAEFEREMNLLRLKRIQIAENYVQQFANNRVQQILNYLKQSVQRITNLFNQNKRR